MFQNKWKLFLSDELQKQNISQHNWVLVGITLLEFWLKKKSVCMFFDLIIYLKKLHDYCDDFLHPCVHQRTSVEVSHVTLWNAVRVRVRKPYLKSIQWKTIWCGTLSVKMHNWNESQPIQCPPLSWQKCRMNVHQTVKGQGHILSLTPDTSLTSVTWPSLLANESVGWMPSSMSNLITTSFISHTNIRMDRFNSLWPSDAICCHKIWVNFGSGNGWAPDGTKPLTEPMLTHHQCG